jgi:hypothetical protein
VLGAYIDDMKIMPAFDDAPDFVKQVEQVVNGIIHRHSPEIVVLPKIDNWFGSNWLGFSGKLLGALVFGANPTISLPTTLGFRHSYPVGWYHNGDS